MQPPIEYPNAAQDRLLKALAHIGQIVASGKDIDTILRGTISLVHTVLDVERCSIMLVSGRDGTLRMRAAGGIPESEWASIRIPVGQGVAGWVAQEGKPILVEDIRTSVYSESLFTDGYRSGSFLCVPLILRGRIIGVISATNLVKNQHFGSSDLELLVGIAGFMALSVENARLHRDNDSLLQKLQAIVGHVRLGIVLIDADGRVTLTNSRARSILGLETDADDELVAGDLLPDLLPESIRPAIEDLVQETLEFGVEVTTESEINRPGDAGTIPIKFTCIPLPGTAERTSGVLLTVADMSLNREVSQLRRVDELKSQFLALVSHEFRTPLTALQGGIHLLGDLLKPAGPSKDVADILHLLSKNALRLSRQLSSLIEVSQLELGTISLEPERLDLAEVAMGVVAEAVEAAAEKQVRLDTDMQSAWVVVDRESVAKSLHRLLENAIKFTPSGSTVTVRVAQSDGTAVASVVDQGPGIPDSHRESIFAKFFQGEHFLTRSAGGTGIGLYLTRGLIEKNGGRVDVEKDTGKVGSTFTITFPAAVPEA